MSIGRLAAAILLTSTALSLGDAPARADVGLFVTNEGNSAVVRLDGLTGANQGIFAQSTGSLSGVAFGPNGNLFVSNLVSQTVEEYNGTSGAFVRTFVGPGGGLNFPHDLNFGPDGNLYVASGETDSIRQYSGTTGAFLSTFASGSGLFRPTGLVFSGGSLYVSNSQSAQILRFDAATGAFQSVFASGNGLDGPAGLTFDAAGNLYVANFQADNVLKFNGAGQFAGIFASGSGLDGAGDVAFGPDGNLYVTSYFSDSILRFDGTTGSFLSTFASGNGLSRPVHLVFRGTVVPEPAGLALLAVGAVGLGSLAAGRRRRPA